MTVHFKNLDIPLNFLSVEKEMCLQWANNVVQGITTPLKLRNRKHSIINHSITNNDWETIENIVGPRRSRILRQRSALMWREFGSVNRIVIDQYDVPEEMAELIQSSMFNTYGIPKDECMPIVQIQNGGELLHPHHGHARKSSLFCLLQGEDEVTKWYRETKPFKVVDEFHIPDISKLEVASENVLEVNQWLLFNHQEWHSVHRKGDVGVRINLGIDFKTMNINECMEYFK